MLITICTPSVEVDVKCFYTKALFETQWPEGAQVQLIQCLGDWTPNACARMVKKSLEIGADYIINTADDIGWKPNAIKKLIAADKDVAIGWAQARMHPFRPMLFSEFLKDEVMFRTIDIRNHPSGLQKIVAPAAGGLTVWKAEIFKKIPPPWFYGEKMVSGAGRLLTEDMYFAIECIKYGVEVWVDWDVPLMHSSECLASFEGKMISIGEF